jgi:hypothetical protein
MRFSVIVLPFLFTHSVTAQHTRFDAFVGTWVNSNDTSSGESWWKTDVGYKGYGFRVNPGGDTVTTENLWLMFDADTVYYVAEVRHNIQPILFRMTYADSDSFRFENQEHDFPKRIEYAFVRSDTVTVSLWGDEPEPFVIHFARRSL